MVKKTDPIMYKTSPVSRKWVVTHVREKVSKCHIKGTPT